MKKSNLFAASLAGAALSFGSTATQAQDGVRTVDSRTSIFGAGNAGVSADGSGLVPVPFLLNPGSGRVLTFASVTGSVGATGNQGWGPDGGNFANIPVNITSFGGISGVIDRSVDHNLGLLGVFTAGVPSGPAPARLDFSSLHGNPTLSPLLNQTIFIGDGLTGTGVGAVQRYFVPGGASAFYLGFADATVFQGTPGTYNNNGGSLTANFTIVPEPGILNLVALGLFAGAVICCGRRFATNESACTGSLAAPRFFPQWARRRRT